MAVIAVIGHVSRTSGVGESARRVGLALIDLGHEVRYFDAPFSRSSREKSLAVEDIYVGKNFDATVLVLNPDLVPAALYKFGMIWRRPKNLIGFWSWEFETAPKIWRRTAMLLDEVWTNSDFARCAIDARIAPTPSVKVPMKPKVRKRPAAFGKVGTFTFLTSFDFLSDFERKNPEATIAAFRLAFGPNPTGIKLVVKSVNSGEFESSFQRLKAEYDFDNSIEFVNGHLSSEENLSLLAEADCFVSLHRTEGFGFNIYDALALGIRVIATNYSGNLEFGDSTFVRLVDSELVPVQKQYSIYKINSIWANPSIHDAAERMREAVRDSPSSGLEISHVQSALQANYEYTLKQFGQGLEKRLDNKGKSEIFTPTFGASVLVPARRGLEVLLLAAQFICGALVYRLKRSLSPNVK